MAIPAAAIAKAAIGVLSNEKTRKAAGLGSGSDSIPNHSPHRCILFYPGRFR